MFTPKVADTCLLHISGHMGLSMLREDTVLDMLGLAHQFNFQELEAAISDYLRQVLALRNVCAVLDAARYPNFLLYLCVTSTCLMTQKIPHLNAIYVNMKVCKSFHWHLAFS